MISMTNMVDWTCQRCNNRNTADRSKIQNILNQHKWTPKYTGPK
jgi:hypothetical protein